MKSPKKARSIISYLAIPHKHMVSRKFRPARDRVFEPIERPIMMLKSPRLDMLAKPNRYHISTKFERTEEGSPISRATLEANLTPRVDHLSRPFVIKLRAMKHEKSYLGPTFVETMNEKIAQSWDTIYYFNQKTLLSMKKEKRKSKSLPTLKKKIWNPDIGERTLELAVPKRVFRPRRGRKRKHVKLEQIIDHVKEMAMPLHPYKAPSQDSFLNKLFKVSPEALQYKPTERTLWLVSKVPKNRVYEKYVPHNYGVQKNALHAKISERVEILSMPRPRANAPQMDLKENPYDINPWALKYKATTRIKELAEPVAR